MRNDYYRCAGTGVLIKNTALGGDFPRDLASLAAGVYRGIEETGGTTTRSINSARTSLPKNKLLGGKSFETGRTTSRAAGPDITTSRVSELKLFRMLFVFLVVVWALSSYLCMQMMVCCSRRVIGWCFPDFLQIGWWSREGPNLNQQDGGAQRDLHPPYGHLLLGPSVDLGHVYEPWEWTGVSVSFPPAI